MSKLITISSALLTAAATRVQMPNIVFTLADGLGHGDVSAFNPESRTRTPSIDKLAEHGIVFTDVHASSALSIPSRCSLLTGGYPWQVKLKRGGLDDDPPIMIDPERRIIAQIFSASGYSTACIGKWYLGQDWGYTNNGRGIKDIDFLPPIKSGPTDRGFDYYLGISASLDISPHVHVGNNKATSIPGHMIEPQKKNLVLLMHGGMAGVDFKPEECLPNTIRHNLNCTDGQKDNKKPFFLCLPITTPHTSILPSKEFQNETSIGSYGDFIVMTDDMVRQIVKTLKKNKQLDNTIIVFASDNGYVGYVGVKDIEKKGYFPSCIYRGYKNDIYEGGHRVPLIVSWKRKYRRETNSPLVSLVDFYATFAQMLNHNLKTEEAADSYSMWPILSKRGASTHKDLVHEAGEGYLSLHTSQLKLMLYRGSGGFSCPVKPSDVAKFPLMRLSDVVKDPSEKESIIGDRRYENGVKEMKRIMKQYVKDGRSTSSEKVSNDTKNSWDRAKIFMQKG